MRLREKEHVFFRPLTSLERFYELKKSLTSNIARGVCQSKKIKRKGQKAHNGCPDSETPTKDAENCDKPR